MVGYRGELAPFSDSPDARPAFIPTDARLRDLWSSTACVALIVNRSDWPRLAGTLEPTPMLLGCEGKKLAFTNRRFPDRPVRADECIRPTAASR